MKKLEKLQEVAELLAVLDLKTSFPETIDVIKEKLAEMQELPLAVIYRVPMHDGSFFLSETRTFCSSLPCAAIRLGKYCLDSVCLWTDNWEEKIKERQEVENAPMWQLPSLTVLTHLSKRIVEVDSILDRFVLHPLYKGWYRSSEKDENGNCLVFNILTGETASEADLKREDICIRLCYFCEK